MGVAGGGARPGVGGGGLATIKASPCSSEVAAPSSNFTLRYPSVKQKVAPDLM